MYHRLAPTLCVLLLLGIARDSRAATVDFEGLADATVLASQIAGLTFSNAIVLSAGLSLNEFEFPPHSGTNVASDSGGPISIVFEVPAAAIGGRFTYTTPLTLTAFDDLDQQIGQASSLFSSNLALTGEAGSIPNEVIEIFFGAGISRLSIAGATDGGSFTIDDLTFASVPEPGTLGLLLPGIALLGAWRTRAGR